MFDASALMAFLQETPGAYRVNELLKEAQQERVEVLMSAVNYGEVYGKILREYGSKRTLTTMQAVKPLAIEGLDATPQRACQAADVKVKYMLYYADSFAAALAIEHKATLVTGDNDFRGLGLDFLITWLKNSRRLGCRMRR
ncbi:MAG: type II toxin-antitoxin system VapC family toxin [Terriglobales bacterium]